MTRMRIAQTWRDLPPDLRGASVAIGNFDGVHRGHLAVLDAARAAAPGAPLAAAVFDPHPRRFFRPGDPPFRLMSDRLRAETLAGAGVDILYVLPFDHDFSQLTDADFARDVLKDGLGAAHVTVGADFRFGRGRAGDAARLTALGAALGFGVSAIAPVGGEGGDGEGAYSSTAARRALRAGDVRTAAAILGRPWIVDSEVGGGLSLGRKLGFPTANLPLGEMLRPRFGVYAVRARIEGAGSWLPGAANLGVRPAVGGTEALLEVFLLDWDGDLYGKRLDVAFQDFVRPEADFPSLEAMTAQIARDVETCRRLLAE